MPHVLFGEFLGYLGLEAGTYRNWLHATALATDFEPWKPDLYPRTEEQKSYHQFTGPARVSKALNELSGLLIGIHADEEVVSDEVRMLGQWASNYRDLFHKEPFRGIIVELIRALHDGVLTSEEVKDLQWLCEQAGAGHAWYDQSTTEIQKLHGILAGIAADGRVTPDEMRSLAAWTDDHQHMARTWPFSEVCTLCAAVLKDGVIDDDERDYILAFFSEFLRVGGHKAIAYPLNEVAAGRGLMALCATAPEIEFREKTFCFTGASSRLTRSKLVALVEENGGRFLPSVSGKIDYLIVGDEGNPAWAFSCYGRKVEQAMVLRQKGKPILIVHEVDFWDAVHGLQGSVQ